MAIKYDSCALHVLTNNCDTDAATATAATTYVYIYGRLCELNKPVSSDVLVNDHDDNFFSLILYT